MTCQPESTFSKQRRWKQHGVCDDSRHYEPWHYSQWRVCLCLIGSRRAVGRGDTLWASQNIIQSKVKFRGSTVTETTWQEWDLLPYLAINPLLVVNQHFHSIAFFRGVHVGWAIPYQKSSYKKHQVSGILNINKECSWFFFQENLWDKRTIKYLKV